ncbi:MAG: hypothetical protein HGGPFJEG_02438 [Ignavibacteria bacterium]|nr:hypothetical protein [Ignavibacteria bacterium]
MTDKEITKILNYYYESLSYLLPNYDSKIRDVFVDLWEIYNDMVFQDKTLNSKRIKNSEEEIIYDNILSLLKLIGNNSRSKNLELLQTCLIRLEIKLEHSQNHLKEARKSLKSLINQIGKKLPDDN